MLQNLRAEMARHNVSSNEIAKCIGKTEIGTFATN